eukprot:3747878-Amphidinium_carterae.1
MGSIWCRNRTHPYEARDERTEEFWHQAVRLDGLRLAEAPEAFKSDSQIVMAAVRQNGAALALAKEPCASDIEIVLAAVAQDGRALRCAAHHFRSQRDVVLAAVSQNGEALQYAAEPWTGDGEIVLAAVQQNGCALRHAKTSCRRDAEIVLAAALHSPRALCWAASELLEDNTFAVDARKSVFILSVSMLSGRSCIVAAAAGDRTAKILVRCRHELGFNDLFSQQGKHWELLHGSSPVALLDCVEDWPGIKPHGVVNELSLVVTAPTAGCRAKGLCKHKSSALFNALDTRRAGACHETKMAPTVCFS